MKIVITLLVFSSLTFAFQKPQRGGNSVGNGGDAVAAEFVQTARTALHYLDLKTSTQANLSFIIQSLGRGLNEVQVNSNDQLFLRGDEVDAINFPELKKIILSRKRWETYREQTLSVRSRLALHEYLGVVGLDDSHYQISSQLIESIRIDLKDDDDISLQARRLISNFLYTTYLFEIDINRMLGVLEKPDLSVYCSNAGSFHTFKNLVVPILSAHSFWFHDEAAGLERALTSLSEQSTYFVNSCANHSVELSNSKIETKKAAKTLIYLIDLFPPRGYSDQLFP